MWGEGATARWLVRCGQGWLAAVLLAGCTVTPVPLTDAERDLIGKEARQRLFAGQAPAGPTLGLTEATARAIKYYADYRLRNLEEVLNSTQLDLARFDLLPRITATAGYSTRNNDSFGFGFSPNGTVATNPSASSERSHETFNLGLAWSVLDFGVSYFKAKQQADQVLIARERRHKAVQILVQDVRRAWFRAEAAQRLLPNIDKLLADVEAALERMRLIESRKLLPPTQVVSLRRSMLELEQQISVRRQELAQTMVELAALINLPPGSPINLAGVPEESRKVLDLTADFELLDATALSRRPELAEEGYKARISEAEAKKGLLAVLPNPSVDLGFNYDSNRFILNNTWITAGFNIALNLVKVFSIPALNRTAEAQRQVDEARRLAMAMAILTQTRVAAVRYSLVAHEYGIWVEAADDDDQMVKLLVAGATVGVDSELELLRARARATISSINRDLSFANLQASVGQLYQSLGYDVVRNPDEEKLGVEPLSSTVQARLDEFSKALFAERKDDLGVKLALAPLGGLNAQQAALIREGMNRVFESSHVAITDGAEPAFRVEMATTLQPPRSGNQPALVTIRLREPAGAERPSTEFKTTLSTPVDDEQLRVLGEGAAYRILLALPPGRVARSGSPRLKPTLQLSQGPGRERPAPPPGEAPVPAPGQPHTSPLSSPAPAIGSPLPAQAPPPAKPGPRSDTPLPSGATVTTATAATAPAPAAVPAERSAAVQPAAARAEAFRPDAARAQDLLMQLAATAVPGPATMPARTATGAIPTGPGQGLLPPTVLDGEPMDLSIDRELSSTQRLTRSGGWLPDATALITNQIQGDEASAGRRQ